ncbi:MAG: efflux RND transporter periplasmic adaptor subunit [Myxococcales bacterium]|jgi:RND family efflux transporter MFP subunit|nr:efflux RND transporter periplasmic adaptor subunit [Myxococcales bacterium]
MSRSLLIPSLIALSSALVCVAGCKPSAAANANAIEQSLPTRTVTVTNVSRGAVVSQVEVVGELRGIEEVRVFSQVADRIRTLTVDEGDKVKKGDLLATIWSEAQSEAVNQAEAALEAALANRDAAKDNVQRMRTLFESHSITASQLEGAEAQYRAAEAQARQATAGVASAGVAKSRTLVRAPISGIVSAVTLREGDLASGAPILTLVRPDRLKAVLRVPERYFFQMEPGMKVSVSPLAKRDQIVEAKLTLKGHVVDRTTRTGLVEIYLDNSADTLIAGSAVQATVELDRRDGVILIPAEAVILSIETDRTGMATVFVQDGDKARARSIKLGVRQENEFEVVEGLAAGESIIVRGAGFLRDGNPIRVAATKAEAGTSVDLKKAERDQ